MDDPDESRSAAASRPRPAPSSRELPLPGPASTGPATAPWVRRALPKDPLPVRDEVRRGLLVGGVLALLGVPAGIVWAFAMPHVAVQKLGSPAYLLPVKTEDLASMGGDLTLIAILLSLGIVAALVVLVWSRDAQLGPLIGLLVGGLCCGLIAMAVGHLLVEGDYQAVVKHAEDGHVFQIRPYVRGRADFVTLPVVGGFVFLTGQLLIWIAAKPTPRVRPSPSSGAVVGEPDREPGPSASS